MRDHNRRRSAPRTVTVRFTVQEVREALTGVAEMLEQLIELFECGCEACVLQASKNMRQLGEELRFVVTHAETPLERNKHDRPLPGITEWNTGMSAAGLRKLAKSVRDLAERQG